MLIGLILILLGEIILGDIEWKIYISMKEN